MRSTFMGLETSKRGLYTQQSALYTTGHNISNANTLGYSRQRVNMSPTLGYPGVGLNAPMTAGFIGTGVEAESVQRIRDQFIDRQYRQETNKLGYYESRTNAISQMEDIMAEPSEYGLNEAFNLFWSSLQDVSTNPEDAASRKVAIQRAELLADSFNYLDTQLKKIQGNLGNEIDVSTNRVNSIVKQIAEINKQIQAIEPNGYMPNDLYDSRDTLLDELNEYLPVSVSTVKSGGNALDIAEGSYTISYNDTNGNEIVLVQGKEYVQLSAMGVDSNGATGEITGEEPLKLFSHFSTDKTIDKTSGTITSNQQAIVYDDLQPSKGKLLSLIDSYGYTHANNNMDGTVSYTASINFEGYYTNMLNDLSKLANTFVNAFNKVHQAGHPLDDSSLNGAPFNTFEVFQITSDGKVEVTDLIIKNPSLLAASSKENEEGNGNWAIELANLQFLGLNEQTEVILDESIDFAGMDLDGATFQSFYESLIGQLGVDGQEAERMHYNTETIRMTVENNRSSMSSVSLDEEMTNMITFQQAYNANARMITVIDETLDKIINGLGRAGL
ncbi:flagellar hook-associated protein FlgK [Ureibacillus sp. GCM10028918]|uniref:flagellar hook-associated protein FlgK n=1 Tax=Ureibacillus sp. GCM10028918 TaxID=3273429 RepID=UPI0036153CF3